MAGLDVIQGKTGAEQEKVINLSYKYGYDTPESFSKAFSRFHGISPAQLRKCPYQIKVFLPLSIKISIQGGYKRYCGPEGFPGKEETRQAVAACMVGEFGICAMQESDQNQFRYYIAGTYQGGQVPDGMTVIEIPAGEWVKFKCIGPMPQALQTVNSRIWGEWLPGNQEFETALPINIEWYSTGDTNSSDYESEIWIPVRRL